MIGSHNYKGDLGDTTVDTATTRTYALNAYATTVGANSFTNGAFPQIQVPIILSLVDILEVVFLIRQKI